MIRRATDLLPLPESAFKLVKAIDTGDASAHDLEKIIASDPGLAASLLRVSYQDLTGRTHYATLRQVIMRLGQRTVRSIAVSLAMKDLWRDANCSKHFDAHRFARHALVVGYLARFVFARRQLISSFDSDWAADELFSAGVLHDLGTGLLARVAPETFDRVFMFAKRSKTSFCAAFKEIYGDFPTVLGAEAGDSWNLPPFFATTQRALYAPWEVEDEYTAQCCLTYAHHLADQLGEGLVPWSVHFDPVPEAVAEVGLEESEVEAVQALLQRQIESYLAPNRAPDERAA